MERSFACMGCVCPHSWVFCSDSQTAQDVSFLTDGPHRHLLQAALGQTRQNGDINKRDGWDFLPGPGYSNFTLPVEKDDILIWNRRSFFFDILINTDEPPDRIQFSGPLKTWSVISRALCCLICELQLQWKYSGTPFNECSTEWTPLWTQAWLAERMQFARRTSKIEFYV